MSTHQLPLHKRFPGQHVARFKVWFPQWTCGLQGEGMTDAAALAGVLCEIERLDARNS